MIIHVHQRYVREGNVEAFQAVIGNGVLFLGLTASLQLLERLGQPRFERALILRDLLNCEVLTAPVDQPLVASWAGKWEVHGGCTVGARGGEGYAELAQGSLRTSSRRSATRTGRPRTTPTSEC